MVYELETQMSKLEQGDQLVSTYYSQLTRLWQQIDTYETHNWSSPTDDLAFKKFIEKKRVFRFLQGLHKEFDSVRSRLLSMKPFPTLNIAFSEVRMEESRIKVMMGTSSLSDGSALATTVKNDSTAAFAASRGRSYNKPYCKHCKRTGHSYDNCYSRPDATVQRPPRSFGSNWRGNASNWRSQTSDQWRGGKNQGKGQSSVANLVNQMESEANPQHNDQADLQSNVPIQQQLDAIFKILGQQQADKNQSETSAVSTATMAHQTGITFLNNGKKQITWIIDSGASDHMTYMKHLLIDFECFSSPRYVQVATGFKVNILGKGTVVLNNHLKLINVLYIPDLSFNLISVRKLTLDNQCIASFSPSEVIFQGTSTGEKIGNAKSINGLYFFGMKGSDNNLCCVAESSGNIHGISNSNYDCVLLWHRRLGHPNFVYLKKIMPKLFLNIDPSCIKCEVCELAKQTKSAYPAKLYVSSQAFNLIHSDIWGPSRVNNINGAKWFISFIDDHTRISWVFLMKQKSEAGKIIQNFVLFIRNQFNTTIKTLRTDNGMEYLDKTVQVFLVSQGIHHQTSCTYTPQQNGVAERKNRHLLEVTRSIMFTKNVPSFY